MVVGGGGGACLFEGSGSFAKQKTSVYLFPERYDDLPK